ncbi:MAG: hypothetical protein R3B84_13140 [Zavarzinella sp.]
MAKKMYDDDVEFPGIVKIACYIWIVFGLIAIAQGIMFLAMPSDNLKKDELNYNYPGLVGALLIGICFAVTGLQLLTGKVLEIVGAAVGSLFIGLLMLGLSGLVANYDALTLAIPGFIAGLGLIVAGVMVIMGRSQFMAWKRAKKKRKQRAVDEDDDDDRPRRRKPPRRRDDDDEEEERPRRRKPRRDEDDD